MEEFMIIICVIACTVHAFNSYMGFRQNNIGSGLGWASAFVLQIAMTIGFLT